MASEAGARAAAALAKTIACTIPPGTVRSLRASRAQRSPLRASVAWVGVLGRCFPPSRSAGNFHSLQRLIPTAERRQRRSGLPVSCDAPVRRPAFLDAAAFRSFGVASAVSADLAADLSVRDDFALEQVSAESFLAPEGAGVATEEEVAAVADLASDAGPNVLNKIGDISEMGLGGWTPAGLVERAMEAVYVYTGLPFWCVIVVTTLAMRAAIFPLVVIARRNTIRLQNISPEVEKFAAAIRASMKEDRMEDVERNRVALLALMREHKTNPTKASLMTFIQMPFLLSVFFALRDLCALPIPDMTRGGAAWFQDLTQPDQYMILPTLSVASFMAIAKFGKEGGSDAQLITKIFFWGAPFTLPLICKFSSGLLVYFLTSQAFSVGQSLLLNSPKGQQLLGIPKRKQHASHPAPSLGEVFRRARENAKRKVEETAAKSSKTRR